MQITRAGEIAYSTPLYTNVRALILKQQTCNHDFKDQFGQPSPHENVTMTYQACACGAARVKLTGPEADLKKALGEE